MKTSYDDTRQHLLDTGYRIGTMDAYGGRITSYSIHYTKLWIQLIDTAGPTGPLETAMQTTRSLLEI